MLDGKCSSKISRRADKQTVLAWKIMCNLMERFTYVYGIGYDMIVLQREQHIHRVRDDKQIIFV